MYNFSKIPFDVKYYKYIFWLFGIEVIDLIVLT